MMNAHNEIIRAADQELASTIEQDIHKKMCDIYARDMKPMFIVLSEKAYLALCYTLAKQKRHLRSGHMLDLEYYRDIMVILDMSASDNIRVLRRPYEEIAYPIVDGGD